MAEPRFFWRSAATALTQAVDALPGGVALVRPEILSASARARFSISPQLTASRWSAEEPVTVGVLSATYRRFIVFMPAFNRRPLANWRAYKSRCGWVKRKSESRDTITLALSKW